jgi:hypothetical protein
VTITLDRTRRHGVMTAGDSETLAGTATDSAGAAIDLTGATIAYSLTDGASTLVSKTGSITVAASGTFSVTLDPADTSGLEAGTYWHSAVVTAAGGTVTTTLRGRLRIARITAAAGSGTGVIDDTWDEDRGAWDE